MRLKSMTGAARFRLVAAGLCLMVLAACGQTPPPDDLVEGRRFPELTLSNFDGSREALASYRGRLLVLNVWATWCAPCRQELPGLERLHRKLDPARFAVVGLSVDSEGDIAQEFLLGQGITFKSYLDKDAALARRLLEIRAYPDTFIISADGVLLRRIVGERDWDRPELVDILRAAAAGSPARLQDV
jgi:thiol-disulfide isomerase/thioredoxin